MKELPEKREEFVAVNSKRKGARRWEEDKGKRRNETQDMGCYTAEGTGLAPGPSSRK